MTTLIKSVQQIQERLNVHGLLRNIASRDDSLPIPHTLQSDINLALVEEDVEESCARLMRDEDLSFVEDLQRCASYSGKVLTFNPDTNHIICMTRLIESVDQAEYLLCSSDGMLIFINLAIGLDFMPTSEIGDASRGRIGKLYMSPTDNVGANVVTDAFRHPVAKVLNNSIIAVGKGAVRYNNTDFSVELLKDSGAARLSAKYGFEVDPTKIAVWSRGE